MFRSLAPKYVRVGFPQTFAISAALRLNSPSVSSGYRYCNARNISSTNEKKSSSPSMGSPVTSTHGIESTIATTATTETTNATKNYLDTLTSNELFGYMVIGMATITRPILDLVIKLFPYTPLWIIRALVYQNYCGGDNLSQVLKTGERLAERGIRNMMVSYTVEACDGKKMSVSIEKIIEETERSVTDALVPHTVRMIEEVVEGVSTQEEITKVINEVPPGYVALKPTGLIENAANVLLHYQNPQYATQYDELVANCERVCKIAVEENRKLAEKYPLRAAPFIVIVVDAERNDLQQGVYKLQRDLMAKFNRPLDSTKKATLGDACVVGTVQMYLKESQAILKLDDELAKKGGYVLGWKLVRGAYIHSEPNRGVIHDTKEDTDKNYDLGISQTIANMKGENPTVGHLVVASHNGDTQLKATQLLSEIGDDTRAQHVRANVILGQLLGMADNITYDLISNHNTKNIIKYVPWGPPLETKEYLLRRLEENGDAVRADSGWPLVKGIIAAFFRRAF